MFFRSRPHLPPPVGVTPEVFPVERWFIEVDALDLFARQQSRTLPVAASSVLQDILIVLRAVVASLVSEEVPYSVSIEEEITATLRDYIPSPMNLFLALSPASQKENGEASLSLLAQYQTLLEHVERFQEFLNSRKMNGLLTQELFIDNKFNARDFGA